MDRDRFSHIDVVGEGATTKVYRDGDKAFKLYLNAPPGEADNEARLQRFAYDAGLPVPVVHGVHTWDDGAAALEMAFIDGQQLMRFGMCTKECNNAVAELVKLQVRVHGVNGIGLRSKKESFQWQIERYLCGVEHAQIREYLLSLIKKLDTGCTALCHGDFHPFNVLFDGKQYWIIDWVNATVGDPLADACHTYLVINEFFNQIAEDYLHLFCYETGARREDVLAWLPVVAATNLVGQDDKGRAYLTEIIERAFVRK
jgi:aminoglycoside phosphotransferase (APT) family kinase protein